MKPCCLVFSLCILLLGACATSRTTPDTGRLTESNRILVVPVEVAQTGQMDGWTFFGSAHSREDGALLLSDALALFSKELGHAHPAPTGRPGGVKSSWAPARTLAKEAATLISSASRCEVLVREEPYTLSSSKRDDPHVLLQEWYRRNTSAMNPLELAQPAKTRILELGLPDYALLEDQLLLQVLVKMVDPSTGKVTARAENRASVSIGSPEELFTHGGKKFKSVFAVEGKRLLEKNLRDIGILPQGDAKIH